MLGIVYPWNLEPYKTNMATQNHAGLEELFPLESGGILALSTPLWVCLKEGCAKLGWGHSWGDTDTRLGKLVQILRRRCAFMCWYHFEPPNISENRKHV